MPRAATSASSYESLAGILAPNHAVNNFCQYIISQVNHESNDLKRSRT
jgi:hypothetical protein